MTHESGAALYGVPEDAWGAYTNEQRQNAARRFAMRRAAELRAAGALVNYVTSVFTFAYGVGSSLVYYSCEISAEYRILAPSCVSDKVLPTCKITMLPDFHYLPAALWAELSNEEFCCALLFLLHAERGELEDFQRRYLAADAWRRRIMAHALEQKYGAVRVLQNEMSRFSMHSAMKQDEYDALLRASLERCRRTYAMYEALSAVLPRPCSVLLQLADCRLLQPADCRLLPADVWHLMDDEQYAAVLFFLLAAPPAACDDFVNGFDGLSIAEMSQCAQRVLAQFSEFEFSLGADARRHYGVPAAQWNTLSADEQALCRELYAGRGAYNTLPPGVPPLKLVLAGVAQSDYPAHRRLVEPLLTQNSQFRLLRRLRDLVEWFKRPLY